MSDELMIDAEPNILVTGTPGTGKSYLCSRLSEQLKFNWIDCSKIAKELNFIEGNDEELDCAILDEDKLLDYLEPIMQQGGNIVEYHSCDLFPERWFQVVYVVTCVNTVLYDRLKERGYNENKVKSNVECEIFGSLLEEARDSYKPEIVFNISGETKKDGDKNLKAIKKWYKQWKTK